MLLAFFLLLTGVQLEADARVRGRVIDVNIRFINDGPPFWLRFPTTQLYEMELSPGGLRWSDDRVFAKGQARRAMGPGTWRLRERWILPPTIEPGEYTLRIWFVNYGEPRLETAVPITISPPR